MHDVPTLATLTRSAGKIAVVRASRLGDFICATPALRALRAAAPKAEITMITLPILRDIVTRLSFIDRFVAFPGFPGIAQQFFNPYDAVEFFRRMQTERFDLAIQLQGSGVYSNPFTLLLGAAATVGFVRVEDDASGLAAAPVWPERGHEIQRTLTLMRTLEVEADSTETSFPLTDDDRKSAADLLAKLPPPLIGLHAGSYDPHRRWPVERFATVGRMLLRRYGGTAVVLGGLQESDRALELTAAIAPGAFNIVGRTSLGTLGAVIEKLSLLITNDSGPAHVGYALRTPTVTIYRCGGTDRYGPPADGPFAGLEPQVDDNDDRGTAIVSVAEVLAAADRLMATLPLDRMEAFECITENRLTGSAR